MITLGIRLWMYKAIFYFVIGFIVQIRVIVLISLKNYSFTTYMLNKYSLVSLDNQPGYQ